MATNKTPFVTSYRNNGQPAMCRCLVQAGSTATIKQGEICAWNKTAGYMASVDAVNDYIYALAIAAEEQKSTDLARYMLFYTLHPDDVFEFEIAAARALAPGDTFILTASNSQKLTYSSSAYPVAMFTQYQTIQQYEGTTQSSSNIDTVSYAQVSFNPACTYWGLIQSRQYWGTKKYITATSALTLYEEMSGLIIDNNGAAGATNHVLPATARKGTRFEAYAEDAQDNGFEPGTGNKIYIRALEVDGGAITVDGIGDRLIVEADGNNDWLGSAMITTEAVLTNDIDIVT